MKTGRVAHIRDAILSTIKRFAFVPTVDNKFLYVLSSHPNVKCQRAKKTNLPAEWSSVQMWHLLAQQHLLFCSRRGGDHKAPFVSHFEIRTMTQFVTLEKKQLQLQLEDPEKEGRKT